MAKRTQYPIFVKPTLPPPVNLDQWFQPLSQPVITRPYRHATLHTQVAQPVLPTALPPILLSEWFQPFSEPRRLRFRLGTNQGHLGSPASALPDIDWLSPWSEPVRRPYNHATFPIQGSVIAGLTDTFDANAEFLDRWYSPFARPDFSRSIAAKWAISRMESVPFTPTVTEVVTVDKWFNPLAIPLRDVARSLAALVASGQVAPPAFFGAELTFLDKWFEQWSLPAKLFMQPPRRPHLIPDVFDQVTAWPPQQAAIGGDYVRLDVEDGLFVFSTPSL